MNDFEEDSYKILNKVFFGKKNQRKMLEIEKIEVTRQDTTEKISKQQSNLTFNGIQKPYTN